MLIGETVMDLIIEMGTIDDVLLVDASTPEFEQQHTQQSITARLNAKTSLILVAKIKGLVVAYKIGYALSENVFYSWLGAVVPAYRQQGIATQLRVYQEQWAVNSGYSCINVKSMNRYPGMLQLLINSGYQIHGYQANEDDKYGENGKILFIKKLI